MKPRCFLKPLFVWALLLAAVSVGFSADAKRAANTVILDETGVKNLRIETVEVEETDFEETVFALGRIEVLPGNSAAVSSRVPGRAVSVLARPDHAVRKGEDVVVIESRQPGDPPPSVTLKAPLDGLVSELKVIPGQPVTPDDALLTIVDLREVYAQAQVPEHLTGKLRKGQTAYIRATGAPEEVFKARLEHTGVMTNRESGSLEAAFYVPNPDLVLRPGMRAEFSIVVNKRKGVTSVPRAALQGDAANRFVYVADFELKNAFVKTPVTVGEINQRSVEITGGLLPGDSVVTNGAYSLGFAGGGAGISLKEALDAAHGHEHAADGSELTPEARAQAAAGAGHDHGHDHAHGEGGGASFWKFVSGALFVLLVASVLYRKRGPTTVPTVGAKPLSPTGLRPEEVR